MGSLGLFPNSTQKLNARYWKCECVLSRVDINEDESTFFRGQVAQWDVAGPKSHGTTALLSKVAAARGTQPRLGPLSALTRLHRAIPRQKGDEQKPSQLQHSDCWGGERGRGLLTDKCRVSISILKLHRAKFHAGATHAQPVWSRLDKVVVAGNTKRARLPGLPSD